MKKIIQILCVLIFCVACGSNKDETSTQTKEKKDSLVVIDTVNAITNDCETYWKLAKKQDSIIMHAVDVDNTVANTAIKAFTDFAYFCQNDSIAPIFLIKTAQIARSVNNVSQAKVVLERCINNYPNFKNLPAAMFLLAQLYDDETFLNNDLEAEKIYKEIIANYPKSEWASNAKGALKFLGKSDNQIMQELKNKK